MNEDDVGPILVADRKADIARTAIDKLRKMAEPPKPKATPKPPLMDAAKAESQAIDDGMIARNKEAQDEAKAAEAGLTVGAVARDVSQGLMETFTLNPARNAVLTGAVNAVDEMGDTLADLVLYPFGMGHQDLDRMFGVIETEGPQSTTGRLVENVTQFATGMWTAGAALKAASLGTAGGSAVQSVARGAIGDVIAFDEADARLSDLIQSYPALRNPVTEYLAGDPDDSFIEAKTKQGMEGVLGGTLAELLFRGVKAYKGYSQAKASQPRAAADAAIKKADATTAVEESLELTPRDWLVLGGDPQKPLISVTKGTEARAAALAKGIEEDDAARFVAGPAIEPVGFKSEAGVGLPPRTELSDMSLDDLGMMVADVPGFDDFAFKMPELEVARLRSLPEEDKLVRIQDEMRKLAKKGIFVEALADDTRTSRFRRGAWVPFGGSGQTDALNALQWDAKGNRTLPVDQFNAMWRQTWATERPPTSIEKRAQLELAKPANEPGAVNVAEVPLPPAPGVIQVGNKVANINLNRIEGPEQLREVARRVGKIMMDEVGPPAPSDEALGLIAKKRGAEETRVRLGEVDPTELTPNLEIAAWIRTNSSSLPDIQAHGIAGADPEKQLAQLLTKGIDKKRTWHTGSLSSAADVSARAGGVGAKVEAPYVLLAMPGKHMKDDGIAAVLVNDTARGAVDDLKAQFPGVPFLTVDDLPSWAASPTRAAPAGAGPRLGPTIRQSTDEARVLSDILLESPDTVRSWLGGQSATGRAFSREEIIGAGEVLTKNLEATRALAQKIATGAGSDADKLAFHRSFALQQSMMALVSQQSREAGRALQAFRSTVGGNKAAARAIRDIMASEGNTEKMASMLLALEHPGQASAFIKKVVEGGGVLSKTGNVAMEIFYNGILSGPRTHMVNIIGNAMNALSATVERGIAARLPGSTIPRGEEAAMLWGTLRGFKDGLSIARQVWKTGVPLQDAAVNSVIKRRAITGEKLVPKSWRGNQAGDWLAAGIDALGTAIRLPGRALMTSDEFFKTIARGQQTSALAYRRATAEGLSGEGLAARIHELRTNPTPDMVDQAFDFAAYQTFTKPLGESGAAVQRILAKNRWAQLVMPFVQTPINIFKYATARTPLGFIMKSVRDDVAAGGARRDLALAQVGMGSMVMATAADYAAQGFITGAAPGDPGQRAAWARAGILPYSIKIPGTDTWVQYTRLDPIGFTVGVAADFAGIMAAWTESDGLELGGPQLDAVRLSLSEKWGLGPQEIEEAIDRLNLEQQQAGRITPERVGGAVVAALRNNMLSRSYLSGIADLFGAFEAPSPEMQADSLGRYLQRTAQGFVPYSAAIRTAEQVLDPQLRDAATAMEALRSMIPGVSEALPPIPDLWGRERETTVGLSPVAVSTERDSPIDHELIRLRLPLNMPGKDIQGTRMTPQEYATFVKLAGDGVADPATGLTAKGTLDAMVSGTHPQPGVNEMYRTATDGPDGGKALLIRTILLKYRDAARLQLVNDFPTLRAAIAERKRLAQEAVR